MLPFLAAAAALFALSFPMLALGIAIASKAPSGIVTADAVRVVVALPLAGLVFITLVAGRNPALSIALALFALSRAAQPASVWLKVIPSGWTWAGALVAALVAGSSVYGFVALCLRVPSGEAMPRWRRIDRMLSGYAVVVATLYAGSVWTDFVHRNERSTIIYSLFAFLIWIGYACGFLGYLDRRRVASGEELLRSRWVAVAIAFHVGIEAIFLLLNLFRASGLVADYLFMLNPAPYAFAYALMRGRIIDVRVFGGRALVYAALTSIPIALLAIVDWIFAKTLANIRVAALVEVAIAVTFSFWLQTLHRRIDRFVERVLFAKRHQAHAALERMTEALPYVQHTETIENMLLNDVVSALEFACGAIYRVAGEFLELRANAGCDGMSPRLSPDDPLVLYARASRGLVPLAALPVPRISPSYALPIIAGSRNFAVVFYGDHRSGEAVDAEEERLLLRLAHAAANAYEHLLLEEREQEIADLRLRLDVADA